MTSIPTGFGPAESIRQAVNGSLTAPLTRTIVYTYDNLYRLTDANYSTGEDYAPMPTMQAATPPPICASRAANRLESLNGQQVYTFDANGTPLRSGDFVATCSTATP